MSTTSGATNSFMFQTNQNLMAIVCLEDLRERCYTLQLVVDSQEDKWSFLRTVSRHVSNTMCRPDPEQLLVRLSARDMSLDASDLNVSSFSRALSSFHKTKQKVGRAFSFNKTPSEPFSQMKLEARKTPLTSRTVVAQSCVDLMEAESPRTSRSFPKRFSFLTQDSPRKDPSGTENRDPDFRTPNLCSRPSFREKFRSRPRAGTLGGITRKN